MTTRDLTNYRSLALSLKDDIGSQKDRIILGAITALIGFFGVWFVVDYHSAQTQYGMCVAGAVAEAAAQGLPVDVVLDNGFGCEAPQRGR